MDVLDLNWIYIFLLRSCQSFKLVGRAYVFHLQLAHNLSLLGGGRGYNPDIMEVNEFGELTHFLYGGARNFLRLKAVWKRVEGDAAFDKARRPYMNHSQRYVDSLGKVKRFQVLCDELMPDDASWSLDRAYDVYLAMDENTPLDVHLSMFIPVLMHHTSAQQRARWLPRAQRFRMIGAYAQTELGHGSNVRALETTATLDKRYLPTYLPTYVFRVFRVSYSSFVCAHALLYTILTLTVHPLCVLCTPSVHRMYPF